MPDTEHANPPAFPNPGYYPDDPQERLDPRERMEYSSHPERGMSLRDYLAAHALQGLCASCSTPEREDPGEMARKAFAYADALLKAREGR